MRFGSRNGLLPTTAMAVVLKKSCTLGHVFQELFSALPRSHHRVRRRLQDLFWQSVVIGGPANDERGVSSTQMTSAFSGGAM